MPLVVVIIVLLIILLAGGLLYVLFSARGGTGSKQVAVNSNLRALVLAQRQKTAAVARGESVLEMRDSGALAVAAAAEGEITQEHSVATSQMTLEKRLKYAKWSLTKLQFRGIQAFTAFACFVPAYMHTKVSIQLLAIVMGWLLPEMILKRAMNQRFEAFDRDYPVLLLSYVSMLKTGMSAIPGLEAAGKGLEDDSLVRAEISLLVERLRLGLSEDNAVGAFGEDIPHPELELFVQSLILSRKVGGQLSQTLERLARQVRKRQEFRKKAVAAIGMERASLNAIAVIMTLLMMYMSIAAPHLVFPAFQHDLGMKIFQAGIAMIVFGFYWSKQVTNIKI